MNKKFRPLAEAEVPEKYRTRVEFNRQEVCQIIYSGRTKNYLRVPVECGICGLQQLIPVNDIRNWCRGQRKGPFPGDHRQCRYTGRTVSFQGYVWIWKPEHPEAYQGKYVPEHILKMEEKLGRYLDRKNESVHHINGDKQDNNISNLQLRTRYHGKGQVRVCGVCGSDNILTQEIS